VTETPTLSGTYAMTMDMYISDGETDDKLVTNFLLPWNSALSEIVTVISAGVCGDLNTAVFPVIGTNDFSKVTYHASLYEADMSAAVPTVTVSADGTGVCDTVTYYKQAYR
jgi:hypothetical protein